MALFPNAQNTDYTFGGKTHTNLVVSEGAAPAEKWIASKEENDNPKFVYQYGPAGNQEVVIAKGKIVELGKAEFDSETSRMISTIKTATEGSKKAFGVNFKNVYRRYRDRFSDMSPTVITRSYIEVPFFEHATESKAAEFATAMKFGAAYGVTGSLQPGDFVKVGKDGNFVKLDTEKDSAFQIVGQVGAVERELPPMGFLQYYMDMDIKEIKDYFKMAGHAPSPGKASDGSFGAYPSGYPYKNKGWKADFEKLLNPTINKGIPFLTDGFFAAQKLVTGIKVNDIFDAATNNDGAVEAVSKSGEVTITDDKVTTAAGSRNNAVFIKLRHEINMTQKAPVTVKLNGTNVASTDLHLDAANNTVVVYLEGGLTDAVITVDAHQIVDPIAGVPTEWDYAGSVGAVRILLQR